MNQTAKCIELRTPDGKLLADLRIYDVSIVEKENGNGTPKPEPAKNGGNGDLMTEAQQRKLFRVLTERGIAGEKALAYLKDAFKVRALREVTKRDASFMIDQLVKESQNGRPAGSSLS